MTYNGKDGELLNALKFIHCKMTYNRKNGELLNALKFINSYKYWVMLKCYILYSEIAHSHLKYFQVFIEKIRKCL